jgi:hypothetical protein
VVGVPVSEAAPVLGELAAAEISPVFFSDGHEGDATADLPYPVIGMSDVMPYTSSVWSTMSAAQLENYRQVWRAHLRKVIDAFKPDLIHTNHIWLMSSLVKDLAPDIPVVAACHATGLRQMELCPGLKDEVIAGCRKIDRFCVLREDHREQLAAALDISAERITVTGAGYRQELFYRTRMAGRIRSTCSTSENTARPRGCRGCWMRLSGWLVIILVYASTWQAAGLEPRPRS